MESAFSRPARQRAAKALVVLVAAALVLTVLAALPTARAPFQGLFLTPSIYTNTFVYVPGEDLEWTVRATAGEVYDVLIVSTADGRVVLRQWDDLVIPASGSVTERYVIQSNLPDGDDYAVEVWSEGSIENEPPVILFERRGFAVREYEFHIETDRRGYLGGDRVVVTWTANRLRDGSLADPGVGQLWVMDEDGESLISPSPFAFSEPAGSFSFDLSPLAEPRRDVFVFGWFNDTLTAPVRHQFDLTDFFIGLLGVLVDVTPDTNAPGGIVRVDVQTVVTFDQDRPTPGNPPQPNAVVDILVRDRETGLRVASYEAVGLRTDSTGMLSHVFQLETAIADGTVFLVEAVATANNVWTWQADDEFTVQAQAALSVTLLLDREAYASGETLEATALVGTLGEVGANFTFIFEVRADGPGGSLLARTTSGEATLSFPIPETYAGELFVRVLVFDGEGNRAEAAAFVDVDFGWVLVNVSPQQFVAGQLLRATYTIRSVVLTDPLLFYEVRDARGHVVASGPATAGEVTYSVPSVPSEGYTFRVTVSEGGRVVTGAATAVLLSGYALTLSFDRSSYVPGETMRIAYAVAAIGNARLPPTFVLSFGLIAGGLPFFQTFVTDQPSGVIQYAVPGAINEGDLLFFAFEGNTGAQAAEVVTVRATNPAWYTTLADIPVFSWLLLVLVLLLFLLLFMTRSSLGLGLPKLRPERPSPPPAEERPKTVMGPMQVACSQCGATIDITTSKRPIEVMCPSCGNTEMVE